MNGERERFSEAFGVAAELGSASLSKWLSRQVRITVEQVEAIPLEQAVGLLGDDEGPVCACVMSITGGLKGLLVLVCDDLSGLELAGMLLGRPSGQFTSWGELEQSAVVETANIIGCAYLNAIATSAPTAAMPSPPWFLRDFAPAVMESVITLQAAVSETIFLTRTEFSVEGSPIRCSLVFVPSADDGGGA